MNSLFLISLVEASENFIELLNANLGIWYLIILNAFGVLAILCKVLEYQIKNRGTMLVVATFANISWVLYFILNGNFTAGLTCVLVVIRMLIYIQRDKKAWARSDWWIVAFTALQTVVAFTTFKNWQDIFSIIAGYVGIFAYIMPTQRSYRLFSLLYMILWLSNSICYFAVSGLAYIVALVSDSFSTCSVLVGIWRYDISKKAIKEKDLSNGKANSLEENKD